MKHRKLTPNQKQTLFDAAVRAAERKGPSGHESTADFKLRIRQLMTGNRPHYLNCKEGEATSS